MDQIQPVVVKTDVVESGKTIKKETVKMMNKGGKTNEENNMKIRGVAQGVIGKSGNNNIDN